jgi:hypothetical protein
MEYLNNQIQDELNCCIPIDYPVEAALEQLILYQKMFMALIPLTMATITVRQLLMLTINY